MAVAGTHLPFPGIEYVEAKDGAFAWVPEHWKIGLTPADLTPL